MTDENVAGSHLSHILGPRSTNPPLLPSEKLKGEKNKINGRFMSNPQRDRSSHNIPLHSES